MVGNFTASMKVNQLSLIKLSLQINCCFYAVLVNDNLVCSGILHVTKLDLSLLHTDTPCLMTQFPLY